MKLEIILAVIYVLVFPCSAVRLHKLFQFIDGFNADHRHKGFLHIGDEYAVFLRTPKPHDKYLVYELYESQNINHSKPYKPTLLAVSKIPLEYVKEQLVTFRNELNDAKRNDNVVPGTQVKTLREWQIEKALDFNKDDGVELSNKPSEDSFISPLECKEANFKALFQTAEAK